MNHTTTPAHALNPPRSPVAQPPILFNTANLVGRVTGYRFKLSDWMKQHDATAAATDEKAWEQICSEIATAGYSNVEVWAAHIDPRYMNPAKAARFREILAAHGLTARSMAGSFSKQTVPVCQMLGLTTVNGNMPEGLAGARALVDQSGLAYNFENHPEKSAQQIRQKIEGGTDRIGICIDTGWLGSQGIDAPAAIGELGSLVRHVHVKDVKGAGNHETTPLGKGSVDLVGVFRELKAQGYRGALSWEDEPEQRNPMDIAAEMRQWIERTWAGA